MCAAVGNADKAFQLYASMKAEGVKSDPQVIRCALSIQQQSDFGTIGMLTLPEAARRWLKASDLAAWMHRSIKL